MRLINIKPIYLIKYIRLYQYSITQYTCSTKVIIRGPRWSAVFSPKIYSSQVPQIIEVWLYICTVYNVQCVQKPMILLSYSFYRLSSILIMYNNFFDSIFDQKSFPDLCTMNYKNVRNIFTVHTLYVIYKLFTKNQNFWLCG